MTRQDFIDYIITTNTAENFTDLENSVKNKLAIRDKFRTRAEEEKDIREFVKNTKDFMVLKINTPFGENLIIVDRSMQRETMDFLRSLGMFSGMDIHNGD